nr:hypothetical protein [Burkholderia ambifaria]
MSDQNTYAITLFGVTYQVPRVFVTAEQAFTEDEVPAPLLSGSSRASALKKRPGKRPRPLLLPISPHEVCALSRENVLNQASSVTDKHALLIEDEDLLVSGTETVKVLQAKALEHFKELEDGPNRKYHLYAVEHYNKSYSDLVRDLREVVVRRFRAAFEKILYVPEMQSWRQPYEREFAFGYEIAADEPVIDELVDLAGRGHVHSQYLAGLLLCFSQRGLTTQSVELILKAHRNKHPQALNALARLLLAQREYIGALLCALVAMDGKDRDAARTVDLIQRSLGTQVIETTAGIAFGLPAIVKTVLDSNFQALARKHFPEWFPSQDDLARAFFERIKGGANHG